MVSESEQIEAFMARAVALSVEKMRAGAGGPFGAIVVLDGEGVGQGWNRVTSANDPTAHAEVEAIRDACARLGRYDLAGGEIYSSCEPCPMCLAAIYWARLERLYYANDRRDAARIGFDDAVIYDERAKPPAERSLAMRRIDSAAARAAFDEWLNKADKVAY